MKADGGQYCGLAVGLPHRHATDAALPAAENRQLLPPRSRERHSGSPWRRFPHLPARWPGSSPATAAHRPHCSCGGPCRCPWSAPYAAAPAPPGRSSRNRAGASVMPLPLHKGKSSGKPDWAKGMSRPFSPQHRPLGAAQRQQLISLPQAVAAEAAQGSPLAVLRPCGRRHLLRQSGPPEKVHPAVERQPEGPRRAMAAPPTPMRSACSAAMA